MVDVDHEEGEGICAVSGGIPGLGQNLVEIAAIGQAGKRIGVGQLGELPVGPRELLAVKAVARCKEEGTAAVNFLSPAEGKGDKRQEAHIEGDLGTLGDGGGSESAEENCIVKSDRSQGAESRMPGAQGHDEVVHEDAQTAATEIAIGCLA